MGSQAMYFSICSVVHLQNLESQGVVTQGTQIMKARGLFLGFSQLAERDWTHPGNGQRDLGTITLLVLFWVPRTPSWRLQ